MPSLVNSLVFLCIGSSWFFLQANALLPHTFWDRRASGSAPHSKRPQTKWTMYFDDCERQSSDGLEAMDIWGPISAWGLSRSDEKRQAVQKLLGHNPTTAAKLTTEEIEDETLQWAVEWNVIWAGDHDDDDNDNAIDDLQDKQQSLAPSRPITSKYESISDLIVANDCSTIADSLALLWNLLSRIITNQETDSVYLVVFPKAEALWDYKVMVTLLQAVAISKPLLPSNLQHLQLDLFHPKFKYAPKMWSPETHAPFPTIGISVASTDKSTESLATLEPTEQDALEMARARLESIFEQIDADDTVNTMSTLEYDEDEIISTCQQWLQEQQQQQQPNSEVTTANTRQWTVDSNKEPFAMYATVWKTIGEMQQTTTEESPSTIATHNMVVTPNLDAHTTHRFAITINAALQRLNSAVRVTNVMHPGSTSDQRKSPFPMIQLSRTQL